MCAEAERILSGEGGKPAQGLGLASFVGRIPLDVSAGQGPHIAAGCSCILHAEPGPPRVLPCPCASRSLTLLHLPPHALQIAFRALSQQPRQFHLSVAGSNARLAKAAVGRWVEMG